MQKIYLEKAIDLQHQLKELIALSVDESINYKIENEGIRAVGNLIIKGEYHSKEEFQKTFEETLELDILATFDKILDIQDFNIKTEDFDYTIRDGNINVTIEAGVHGVVSEEDRYVNEVEEIKLKPFATNIVIKTTPKLYFKNKLIELNKKYQLTLEDGQIWIGEFEEIDCDIHFMLDIPTNPKTKRYINYAIDEINIEKIEEV